MKLRTHKQFINKVDKVHPERTWKIIGDYIHNMTPILVEDKYGKCLIKPNAILQRSKPSVKTAIDKTKYTINKFKEVWGDELFDYSKFEYKGAKIKSTIICKAKNHHFLSHANNHLCKRGCPQCAQESISERVRSNTKEFIKKAIAKYGVGKYSFTKTNYEFATKEVIITCKKHGDFEQTPNRFLNGQICNKCGYKKSKTNFHKQKEKLKRSLLYIIECYNEEERFIKVGVTTKTVKTRFRDSYDMPYKYNILRTFQYANIDAPYSLETKLLNFTKTARYKPKNKFNGHTEARIISIKDSLLDFFDICVDYLNYTAFINFAEAYNGEFDKKILNSGNYTKVEINSVIKGLNIYKNLESGLK